MITLSKALHNFNAISIKYQWHFFMKLEQIISNMKTSVSSVQFSRSVMSISATPWIAAQKTSNSLNSLDKELEVFMLLDFSEVKVKVSVTQLCPTLCNHVGCM